MKQLTIAIIFLITIASVSASSIRINEIMYDPLGKDNNLEFIELYSEDILPNLVNYTVSDVKSEDKLTLLHYEDSNYALIVEESFIWQGIPASIYSVGATIGNGLNNDQDSITIKDKDNNQIDLFLYTSSLGAKNNGKSLEFLNSNFLESIQDNGTPGKENSAKEIEEEKEEVIEEAEEDIEEEKDTQDTEKEEKKQETEEIKEEDNLNLLEDNSLDDLESDIDSFAEEQQIEQQVPIKENIQPDEPIEEISNEPQVVYESSSQKSTKYVYYLIPIVSLMLIVMFLKKEPI